MKRHSIGPAFLKNSTACTRASSETQGQIARQGKCKRAKENGDEEKHSMARRAPGDKFLPDQFQRVVVILNSDWCQKFFLFFCPIRGQQAVKSFRVFLHGNHLIAILAWFIWQGFARGENSQSQHKMYRKSFGISAEKYAEPFAGIFTVAYFQVCGICLKMSSPIHLLKIAVIYFDLTIIFILPPFPGRGIGRGISRFLT